MQNLSENDDALQQFIADQYRLHHQDQGGKDNVDPEEILNMVYQEENDETQEKVITFKDLEEILKQEEPAIVKKNSLDPNEILNIVAEGLDYEENDEDNASEGEGEFMHKSSVDYKGKLDIGVRENQNFNLDLMNRPKREIVPIPGSTEACHVNFFTPELLVDGE